MTPALTILFFSISLLSIPGASHSAALEICEKSKLFGAHNVDAWSSRRVPRAFFYKSGLAVDADGAFRAYHPIDRLGLDSLSTQDTRETGGR